MKKLLLILLAMIVVAPAWGGSATLLSTAVTIELNNLTDKDDVSALVKKLEKNTVFKAAACEPARTIEATTQIDCARADKRLMGFLSKNAPPTVRWSIAPLTEKKCPVGCAFMHCPPPYGGVMCCNLTTYKACQ